MAVKTATAEAAPEAVNTQERRIPEITPSCVREHSSGQCWHEFFVILPPGSILDDLKIPSIWRPVQIGRGNRPLRILDRLSITNADYEWLVEARVAGASSTGVSIAITKKIDLDTRTESLPQTETHKVAYSGPGMYCVMHKATNQVVGVSYQSLAAATAELYRMVPTKR